MKLIKCIFRQEKLADLIAALQKVASGMTVSEVHGRGRQKGHSTHYRGIEYTTSLLPKTMIEIVADDNKVDDLIEVVMKTARTGNIGDGRIFVHDVEAAYHVRTGFLEF